MKRTAMPMRWLKPLVGPSGGTVQQTSSSTQVRLQVYDLLGRRVRRLVAQDLAAGTYRIVWDGTDDRRQTVAAGVYFRRVGVEGRPGSYLRWSNRRVCIPPRIVQPRHIHPRGHRRALLVAGVPGDLIRTGGLGL